MSTQPMTTGTPRRRVDVAGIATGVSAIAVGAVVIPYGMGMPNIREGIPGPGLFPMMIGGLLLLFGTLQLISSVVATRRGTVPSADELAPPPAPAADLPEEAQAEVIDTDIGSDGPRRWINGVIVFGSILFYILLAPVLGFPITMFIVVSAILLALRAKWWVALTTGVLTSLALWAMFEQGLLVQLPDGIIPGF